VIGLLRRFCYNGRAMDLHPGFAYLPALLVQALCLMLLSWLLFRAMMFAFGDRNGGGLVTVIRLPGNLIHEASHALGYLLFGFRVRHMVPCVLDPRKSGLCVRGKPWSPVTLPWLADGAAALMPLVVGSLALVYLGRTLGIIDHQPAEAGTGLSMFRPIADEFLLLLGSLDWHQWQSYAFLYLALSVGAETSPSHTDLRYAVPALGGLGLGLVLMVGFAQRAPLLNHMLTAAADWLLPTLKSLVAVWGLALLLMLVTVAVAVPATFVIYSLRPQRR